MRIALVTLALTLTACSSEPDGETVTIKFQLAHYDTAYLGCQGTGGYDDIGPGTSVTIRNGEGDIVGTGELGDGDPSSNGSQAAYCDWTVEIADVPADEDFYSAEIGDRGEITSSRADLEADGWTLEVSLGEL